MKTAGTKNTFKNNVLYYLTAAIPLIEKRCGKSVRMPQSWKTGGGLSDYAAKFGIEPDWDNGREGIGHKSKYTGKKMYLFVDLVVGNLKARQQKKPVNNARFKKERKKAEEPAIKLTPIEEAIYESRQSTTNKINEANLLEQALIEAANELINVFEEFKKRVLEAMNT